IKKFHVLSIMNTTSKSEKQEGRKKLGAPSLGVPTFGGKVFEEHKVRVNEMMNDE
ncbi:MAG: hypothetical protein QG657_5820, partial [Acidobacteriota bacterium]|nr:hypothetical protein [Acidobacteriota bacterium]